MGAESCRDWLTCLAVGCAGETPARQPAGSRRYASCLMFSQLFYYCHRTLLSLVGLQDLLAKT